MLPDASFKLLQLPKRRGQSAPCKVCQMHYQVKLPQLLKAHLLKIKLSQLLREPPKKLANFAEDTKYAFSVARSSLTC